MPHICPPRPLHCMLDTAGQAVVQFAEDPIDQCEYAIKFFLDQEAFLTEAALYASCSRAMAATLAPSAIAGLALITRSAGSGECASSGASLPVTAARFLPQVEAVHDGANGGVCDPRGRALPPCIVMEKGESLHDWSDRAEPDLFMSLAVQPLLSGHASAADYSVRPLHTTELLRRMLL